MAMVERSGAEPENTHLPSHLQALITTGNALLRTALDTPQAYLIHRADNQAVWERRDQEQPQFAIRLGLTALEKGLILAVDNHRPRDHTFPQPPTDLNEVHSLRGYEQMTLSIEGERVAFYKNIAGRPIDGHEELNDEQLAYFAQQFDQMTALMGLRQIVREPLLQSKLLSQSR